MRFAWKLVVGSAVISLIAMILVLARLKRDLDDEAPFLVSTTKVCQLTGVEDRERPGRRTGQLLSGVGAGVTGSDLGFPFEHRDRDGERLIFLFGDTRETDPDLCDPGVCGTTTAPKPLRDRKACVAIRSRIAALEGEIEDLEVQTADAPGTVPNLLVLRRTAKKHELAQAHGALVACEQLPGVQYAASGDDWDAKTRGRNGADSVATVPIQSDPQRCLPLKFETDTGDTFHGLTLDGEGKTLGLFETPISGFSDGEGTIYAFFTIRDKPHGCTRPEGCPLGDGGQPGGQSKLAFSTDRGRTFKSLWTVSKNKFQWPVPLVVEAKDVPGLPRDFAHAGKIVLIWGTERAKNLPFRFSYPYLAVADLTFFRKDKTPFIQGHWRYYDGTANWTSNQDDALPLPPFGSPAIENDPKYGKDYHRCIGEFSVQYDPVLTRWLMLYACGFEPPPYNPNNKRGIFLRMADAPWGPWSKPRLVFDPGQGYCHFMHAQDPKDSACLPNPADLGFRDQKDAAKDASGGEYAPFLLPSRYNDYSEGRLTFYFVMSTWNPYQVVQMKTELRRAPWWKRFLTTTDRLESYWLP